MTTQRRQQRVTGINCTQILTEDAKKQKRRDKRGKKKRKQRGRVRRKRKESEPGTMWRDNPLEMDEIPVL